MHSRYRMTGRELNRQPIRDDPLREGLVGCDERQRRVYCAHILWVFIGVFVHAN